MADEKSNEVQEPNDPLSFFAAGGDSSDSDSDEDAESSKLHNQPNRSDEHEKSPESKLPSPRTLFATVGRPAFLDKKEEYDLDWNSLSKRYEPSVSYAAPPVQFNAATEQNDEYDDAVISSAPIKYKREASEIQKHLLVHHKRTAEALKILDDRGDAQHKGERTRFRVCCRSMKLLLLKIVHSLELRWFWNPVRITDH